MEFEIYATLGLLGGLIGFSIYSPKTYEWILFKCAKIWVALFIMYFLIYIGRCSEIKAPSESLASLETLFNFRYLIFIGALIFFFIPWGIQKIKTKVEKPEDKTGTQN
jgi:hypothetical protein